MDKIKSIMLLSTTILLLICLLTLFFSCDLGDMVIRRQIDKYRGDGIIAYIKKPGLLGRSGVNLDFPYFKLSEDFSAKYNISGIPLGKDYLIYLVPSKNSDADAFYEGICTYTVLSKGKVIEEQSERISEMAREESSNVIKYYFYEKGEGPRYTNLGTNAEELKIIITFKNLGNAKEGRAFFKISSGGFK